VFRDNPELERARPLRCAWEFDGRLGPEQCHARGVVMDRYRGRDLRVLCWMHSARSWRPGARP
jgi:hypothetical protein